MVECNENQAGAFSGAAKAVPVKLRNFRQVSNKLINVTQTWPRAQSTGVISLLGNINKIKISGFQSYNPISKISLNMVSTHRIRSNSPYK